MGFEKHGTKAEGGLKSLGEKIQIREKGWSHTRGKLMARRGGARSSGEKGVRGKR